MATKVSSDSAKNTKKSKKKPRGKPFQANDPETGKIDERINRVGVRKFDELRHLTQRLLNENTVVGMGDKQQTMRQIELLLRQWIVSMDYQKQSRAVEYGFGKVPDELISHSEFDEFVLMNLDLFTDGQLARIKSGEDKRIIVAELLRETLQAKRKK